MRLNRWASELSEFDFAVIHIKSKANGMADTMSRLIVRHEI